MALNVIAETGRPPMIIGGVDVAPLAREVRSEAAPEERVLPIGKSALSTETQPPTQSE